MKYNLLLFLLLSCFVQAVAQPGWKLSKDKDGIKIYTGINEDAKYKSIRVQCTLTGTIAKLQSILRDVNNHPKWVYNSKNIALLKQLSPDDIIYYLETEIPWPVSNRDGVYRLTISTDSLHHSLSALIVTLPGYVPEKDGIVRIGNSKATWAATEAAGKISIDYIFEVDPSGSLPAWAVNMFADKGPYETFRSLAKLLTQ